MELVHFGGVVQEQGEAQEWVDLVGEEWAAPERVQVRMENACVQNAGLSVLMRPESHASIRAAQNVERGW